MSGNGVQGILEGRDCIWINIREQREEAQHDKRKGEWRGKLEEGMQPDDGCGVIEH